jgi:Zn finger protein HypA/HybF involved in hydrogenase expression
LITICEQNNIKRIDGFTIVVSHGSHVNEDSLRQHLELNNRDIIGKELKIELNRDDIAEQTAIIYRIQGETFEK